MYQFVLQTRQKNMALIPMELFRFRNYDHSMLLANTNTDLQDIVGDVFWNQTTYNEETQKKRESIKATIRILRPAHLLSSMFLDY
ncbi:BnaC08g20150D [Brassica napus]|uniref:(rape) hypothetical protein n=1 Tax=Brassica napus TaxID=3708 RepID=A0A078HMJ9_BRANA|nr:unnamed protein product [Brassica napus]CDY38841.1 BnaC08g20150D [Brassica napus]